MTDLKTLFPGMELPKTAVSSVTSDSRKACPGSLFVALRGFSTDGHLYAADAYRRGCRLFALEHAVPLPEDALQIVVKDTTELLPSLAATFYGRPADKLHVIGITGTKGKTSSALMLYHILNACGILAGYIGTLGVWYKDHKQKTANTTPDPLTLHSAMRKMVDEGVKVLVLEVSSQSVPARRIDGIKLFAAGLTNLYPDHVGPGEHPSLAEYYDAKVSIVCDYGAEHVLVSEEVFDVIAKDRIARPFTTFGMKDECDIRAFNVTSSDSTRLPGEQFTVGKTSFTLPVPGLFSVRNALLAIGMARILGLSDAQIANALHSVCIPGRMEGYVLPGGALAVIDYAHNGESLSQALSSLSPLCRGKLLCLVGSVGGRTQIRREEIGQAAATLCNKLILTSDNPDFEDPAAICREIEQAARKCSSTLPVTIITEREEAIRKTVAGMRPSDVLLLAGKGHEDYQLIKGEKIPFSERQILLSVGAVPAV